MRHLPSLLLTLVICLNPLQAKRKPVWTPVMPVEYYKALSLEQRAQADKAYKLFEKGGEGENRKQQQLHKSAANEWERFRVQYADSLPDELFGYSLFMQAMAQQRSANRHSAVRTYTEVLDFYPSTVWLAAPALYHRGQTHEEIGDLKKAYQDYAEITEDPAYQQHVLAGNAFLKVADNHWQNKRGGEAMDLWRKLETDFGTLNPPARSEARKRMFDQLLVSGQHDAARDMRKGQLSRGSDEAKQATATRDVFRRIQDETYKALDDWYFRPHIGDKKKRKQQDELILQTRAWFEGQAPVFSAVGQDWYYMSLRFDDLARYNREGLKTFVPELASFLQKTGSAEEKRTRAKDLVRKLARIGQTQQGLALLSLIPDASERFWSEFDLFYQAKSFKECERVLDQLAGLKDGRQEVRIFEERADLYHKKLGKYEEAIKLYHQINDPKTTLWEITDCYRRLGKKEQAQKTLTEIVSIFPDLASRAVYQKAEYYRSDGVKESAIGLYRNLLAHPEWKKSKEASRAHDRLEDMGIETGGAVLLEVN